MDDTVYGSRDKRGDWRPKDPLKPPHLFVRPFQVKEFVRWLPHYFWPWNALFLATAWVFWTFLTPSLDTMQTLEIGWVLALAARNALIITIYFGLFEWRLYTKRAQANRFKYNAVFPADKPNKNFLRGSQNFENILWTFGSAIPIWTAFEAGILWLFANGMVPMASFAANPLWLLAIMLLARLFHEAHFYAVHRLIHLPFLYRHIHAVHHKSVNPSPWSSLAMHPGEHLLYFSGALIHLLIFSHPLLAIYQLHIAALGALGGHFGFDKVETGDDQAINTDSYDHYLHHKYFVVNYASGLVPFDRIFGTWHDGTPEAQAKMLARRKERRG